MQPQNYLDMKNNKLQRFSIWITLFLVFSTFVYGQGPVPFTISNNSTFADSDLYVAIVGIDYTTGNHVWVNAKTSQVLPMNASYNTVTGPTYGGNTGPGQNSKYLACFTKLSEIPNKTFTLPLIAGCRVLFLKDHSCISIFSVRRRSFRICIAKSAECDRSKSRYFV